MDWPRRPQLTNQLNSWPLKVDKKIKIAEEEADDIWFKRTTDLGMHSANKWRVMSPGPHPKSKTSSSSFQRKRSMYLLRTMTASRFCIPLALAYEMGFSMTRMALGC